MDAEGNSLTLVLLQGVEKTLQVAKDLPWRLLDKPPVSIDYLRAVLLETERLFGQPDYSQVGNLENTTSFLPLSQAGFISVAVVLLSRPLNSA